MDVDCVYMDFCSVGIYVVALS